jgi:hypothetical protein
MPKSKPARSIKPRSASKNRSKVATRKRAAAHHETRANSKQARILELLRRPGGATIALAVALGPGLLCWRGAQEARAHACFREDRLRPCLPDH